jgi:hypothetical protein
MSKRSIVIGVLAAILMGAYGQYAQKYIPGTWGLIRGHLPISVFGTMIFFATVVNPLLGRIFSPLRLKPGEMALITGLLLVGAGIADAGMMRFFPRELANPLRIAQHKPGWIESDILSYTPKYLLANDGVWDPAVMDGYFAKSGSDNAIFPFRDVPWSAWRSSLLLWGTLGALFMLGNICLAVITHRQWATKERLRYPLAEIGSSLFRCDEQGRSTLLSSRVFWIGFGFPFAIRMISYLNNWFPNSVTIPLSFDFSALRQAFPTFFQTPGASNFATPTLFPVVIGMSFLLASDIGFSMGIANVISVAVMYFMIAFGLNLSGGDMQGGYIAWQVFGSFLAAAVMIFYVGRRYYWQTAKEAVTFRTQAETDPSGVWGLRLFFLCAVFFVAILSWLGVHWSIGLLVWTCLMVMVLVLARMNAEAGTFFTGPGWFVMGILAGLFGMTALGPTVIIVVGMIMVLFQGGFEAMMPYVVNGLKMSTDTGQKTGRIGLVFGAGLLLALAVTIPTALWADYHHPAALRRGGDSDYVWEGARQAVVELSLADQLKEGTQASGFHHWSRMRPNRRFVAGVAIGFAAFIAIGALRLRYAWWPLHPIVVLLFGSAFAARFGFSFFVGWLIKVAVTKFGGGQKYVALKPAMIGMIVGDLAGGFSMIAINMIYYAGTGNQAPRFWNTLLW